MLCGGAGASEAGASEARKKKKGCCSVSHGLARRRRDCPSLLGSLEEEGVARLSSLARRSRGCPSLKPRSKKKALLRLLLYYGRSLQPATARFSPKPPQPSRRFAYSEICGPQAFLSGTCYLAIASTFEVVVIDNIDEVESKDDLRRLTQLVDVLYEHRRILVCAGGGGTFDDIFRCVVHEPRPSPNR
jgi:hypothetical protein